MRKNVIDLNWVLLVALLVAGTGCTKQFKKNRYLALAERDFKAERYDRAEIEYQTVLRISPDNPEAIYKLGLLYSAEGRVPQAMVCLRKAVELQPENQEGHLKLGQAYLGLRMVKEARQEALKVLEKQPANGEAMLVLAESAQGTNEVQETIERLETAPPAARESAVYHVALATLYGNQGRLDQAETELKEGVAKDAKSSLAQMALGNSFLLRNDLKQAETALKTAADLAPMRSLVRLRYADFKLRTGNVQEATNVVGEITRKAPDYVPAWNFLAQQAFGQQRLEECQAWLNSALARDPVNADALVLRGNLLLANGDPTNAVSAFERVISIYGKVPVAEYHMARAQLQIREIVKAMASLSQAIAGDTNYVDALLLQAALNLGQGNASAAVSSMNRLVRQQPGIPQAQLLLAKAYVAQSDMDSALGVYRRMTQAFSTNASVLFDVGGSLALLLHQTNESVRVFRNLVSAFPTNSQILLAAGRSLGALAQGKEGRAAIERSLALAPDFLPAVEALVDLDLQESQEAAAFERVQKQIDKDPRAAVPWLLMAKIHLSKASAEVAKQNQGRAPALAKLQLADVPAVQEEVKQAEAALLKAIELDSNLPTSYQLLAGLYVASRKQQQALDRLNSLVSRTNDVGALTQIAMILDQMKNFPAARDAYERVLKLKPNSFECLNNLAYIRAERLGEVEQGYRLVQKAANLRPGDPSVADTLGWILYRRGDYSRALDAIEQSATRLGERPEIQYHLGMANYMVGAEEPARLALEKAVQSGQEFEGKDEAARRLKILAVDVKTADAASVADLEKQLKEVPNDPIALARVAAIQERDGAFDKAIGTYEQIVKNYPQNSQVMLKLALLYERGGQKEKALEAAKSAHSVAVEDPRISAVLGRLVFQLGNQKWAASLLEDSSRKLPDDPQVAYDLAWAWYSVGRVTEAENAMQRASRAGAAFARGEEAKRFLAMVAASKDPKQCQQLGGDAGKLLAVDPKYVPALMVSAISLEQQGSYKAAGEAYDRVLALYPSFTPAARNLAILCLERLQDEKKAYDLASRARQVLPQDAEIAKTLGICAYRKGDFSRAAQLLKESAQSRTDDAAVFYHLGLAQYRLKAKAESITALQRALTLDSQFRLAEEARTALAEMK